MKNRRLSALLWVLALTAVLVSACQPAATAAPATAAPTSAPATSVPATVAPTTAPTAAPKPTDTAVPPTAEPTAVPLGTTDHPIIMGIAPSATSDVLIASGDTIAKLLSAETGLVIKAVVPANYKALIEAMCSGNSQIGWLPTYSYLLAHQTMTKDAQGKDAPCADVAEIAIRNGLDHYATQFVANAAAGFTVYPAGSDPNTALKQFDGKKPCWVDPLSTSGYIIPFSMLKAANVQTKPAAIVQGHPTVIRALYAGGICDFGATFVDARTTLTKDLPDVNDKVQVIYQTDNIIPNDTVSFAYDVPADMRAKLLAALDKVSKSAEGAAAIKTLYQIDGLKPVDDTFFDEFRVLLAASGIDIASLVK